MPTKPIIFRRGVKDEFQATRQHFAINYHLNVQEEAKKHLDNSASEIHADCCRQRTL